MGCSLEIEENNGVLSVSGNNCKRGEIYGKEEYTHPKRTVTSLVRRADGVMVSVKTSDGVPKEQMFEVVNRLKNITAPLDCAVGDVLEKNVLGSGADIIVTGIAEK
jgi:CxxC motif-containing protein